MALASLSVVEVQEETWSPYEGARVLFEEMMALLSSSKMRSSTHEEVEDQLHEDMHELARRLFQGHLDERGDGDMGSALEGSDGVVRERKRRRGRELESKFGTVEVERFSYEAKGSESLHPKDAILNMPSRRYSHPLTKQVVHEVAKGSFDEAVDAVNRTTRARVPKRQVELLARDSVVDFDAFYEQRVLAPTPFAERQNTERIIVLTSDGKGIAMLHRDLREETRKAAEEEAASGGRSARLEPGKKRYRKRRAMVLSVYETSPFPRTPEMLVSLMREESPPERPDAERKRVWASVELEQGEAISATFDEAQRRDPSHLQPWVVLLDGERSQIEHFRREAAQRGVEVILILDIVHALEYLWRAGKSLGFGTRQELDVWLEVQLFRVLYGAAEELSVSLREQAKLRLGKVPKAVSDAARYLHNHADMMDYQRYLSAGYPIGTGVIEGACRHLVKDRLERTGARWSLEGAEAVLRLRALLASGDFDEYWAFHVQQEHSRNHASRYAQPLGSNAAGSENSHLRLVSDDDTESNP